MAPDDRVLVVCITSCGRCAFCREGHYGLCMGGGGWIFGHLIDGLQAEFARVPFADTSAHKIPDDLTDGRVLFLADILPTAFEVGVLNGDVKPGVTVVIVEAGPIRLAAIVTAKLYSRFASSPSISPTRGSPAPRVGADTIVEQRPRGSRGSVIEMTNGLGADVAMEAVGSRRRSSSAPISSDPAVGSRTSSSRPRGGVRRTPLDP